VDTWRVYGRACRQEIWQQGQGGAARHYRQRPSSDALGTTAPGRDGSNRAALRARRSGSRGFGDQHPTAAPFNSRSRRIASARPCARQMPRNTRQAAVGTLCPAGHESQRWALRSCLVPCNLQPKGARPAAPTEGNLLGMAAHAIRPGAQRGVQKRTQKEYESEGESSGCVSIHVRTSAPRAKTLHAALSQGHGGSWARSHRSTSRWP
jgi:hypothetical protein